MARLEPKILWLTPKGNWSNPQSWLAGPHTPENRKYIKQGIEEWQNHLKPYVFKNYYRERPTNERRRS
jgi:hypothetical protein